VKRLLLTALIGCALLSMAPMAVHATPPTEVSGEGYYWFQVTDTSEAGPNIFMEATEQEDWYGDMIGRGNSEFRVAMLAAGFWTVQLRCVFEGMVGDKEGTLQIQMVGKKPLDEAWYGQWVILGGTGELANAHGGGTWWGPGYRADEKVEGDPDFFYSGQVHFDPH
jgi:hypothetical protein